MVLTLLLLLLAHAHTLHRDRLPLPLSLAIVRPFLLHPSVRRQRLRRPRLPDWVAGIRLSVHAARVLRMRRAEGGLQLVGLRLILNFAGLAVLALVLLGLRREDLRWRGGGDGVGLLRVLEAHCWLGGGVAVGWV